MAPQKIEVNYVKLTTYTKHFGTEINAIVCRIKHQRNRIFCGTPDHTSMDIEQPQITDDLEPTSQQCKQACEGRSLILFDLKLNFDEGKKKTRHNTERTF